MGNIQVKVCDKASIDNAFNCANKSLKRAGRCKGNLKLNFYKKSPEKWNGDRDSICASGYEAWACGSGGCACRPTENCGKLKVLPMIIFTIIAIIVIYVSIMSYAAAKGDIELY